MPHQTTFCLSPWFLLLCLFDRFFWGKVGKVDLCLLVNIRLWDSKISQILSKNCDLRQTSWRAEELLPGIGQKLFHSERRGESEREYLSRSRSWILRFVWQKRVPFQSSSAQQSLENAMGHRSASLTRVFNKFEFYEVFIMFTNLEGSMGWIDQTPDISTPSRNR